MVNIPNVLTTEENYYSKFRSEVRIKLEAHYEWSLK